MLSDAPCVLSPGSEKGLQKHKVKTVLSSESRSREGCPRGTAVTAQSEGAAIPISSGARGTRAGGPGPTGHPGRGLEEVGADLRLED